MTTADLPHVRRTPATVRAAGMLAGGIIGLALVLGGAWTLLSLAARHTFVVRASYAGVRSLIVNDDSGNVLITGAPTGTNVIVSEHISEGLTTPRTVALRTASGGLRLAASCPISTVNDCGVRYDVAVPAGTAVLASSGDGDVTATHLTTTAAVRLSSGAGDVTVSGISAAQISLSSDDGQVSARTIAAPRVQLSSAAGDVTAELAQPARVLIAHSAAGDVRLTVPNEIYAVHASSAAGAVGRPRSM